MISWVAGDNRINFAGQKRTSDAEKRGDKPRMSVMDGFIFVWMV
jgi:hypothetical protein